MNLLSALSTFKSGFENLAEDATITDKLLYGLKVAAIGIVIVFLVLILIWIVLALFKVIFYHPNKQKKADTATTPVAAVPSSGDLSEEAVTAIATAAIAASRGTGNCAFKVISVTKIQ